jgi:hypothetical protein
MCKFWIPFGEHKFKCKNAANWFVSIILWFVPDRYWITIWDTTYYPETTAKTAVERVMTDPMRNKKIVKHEGKHYLQWDKYGVFFPLLYLFLPLPFLFAYFRWMFEREAYLVDILEFDVPVDIVVNALWYGYVFTWPPCLMRSWFNKRVEALKGAES